MFNLGNRIQEKRKLLLLTQQELANRCDLTKGYISQLENNKVSPSIETLEIILEVLGISLSDFFNEKDDINIIFNKDETTVKDFDGYIQTWLVPTSQKHEMEPIIVEIEEGVETFHDYPHNGEEFGYVLEGEIEVIYDNKKYSCKEHESFYFESSKKHFIKAKTKAKVIWVSCPPNF